MEAWGRPVRAFDGGRAAGGTGEEDCRPTDVKQQCKDQGLLVSGSKNDLVQRLLAATEAEDDLETCVESSAASG